MHDHHTLLIQSTFAENVTMLLEKRIKYEITYVTYTL